MALRLPEDLMHTTVFPHPANNIDCIETHASWVILAGDYAYKIKKPVNFGFLDFSTLEKRHDACREELRINRRTAPRLYEALVSISDVPVRLDDDTRPVAEYAIRMQRFPQSALLSNCLDTHPAPLALMDALAQHIADFHATASIAPLDSVFGSADSVLIPVQQNIRQLREQIDDNVLHARVDRIEQWTQITFAQMRPLFTARQHSGHIRECHGDLHLGNIIELDGHPLLFDALEFNASLRWIDVVSDIAFLVMDLHRRAHPELGWHVLNRWLEHTGDYAALHLLPWYLCYRAMVRAKVAALRVAQLQGRDREIALAQCEAYLSQALRYTQPRQTALIMTHGISGSGKTTHSQYVVDHCGLIRLRADVERKRLFGLPALASSRHIPGGIYSETANEQTQHHLEQQARDILGAGFPVLVDATFIRQEPRQRMQAVARELDAPWYVLAFEAAPATLRARATQRSAGACDASEADAGIVDQQIAHLEPLQPEELTRTLCLSTDTPPDWRRLLPAFTALTGIG